MKEWTEVEIKKLAEEHPFKSYRQLAKELGRSLKSVEMKNRKIKERKAVRTCEFCGRKLSPWQYGPHLAKHYGINPTLQYPNLGHSPDLAYVLGVIEGDGNIYPQTERGGSKIYIVRLAVTSKAFANSFASALNALNLSSYRSKVIRKQNNHSPLFEVRMCSKFFSDWYLKLSDHDLFSLVKAYPEHFLRGLYESEGSNPNSRELKLSNTDEKIISLACTAVDLLDFRYSVLKEEPKATNLRTKTAYTLKILGGGHERNRFLKTVNPCIKNELWLKPARRRWTQEEINKLREEHPFKDYKQLAKDLGRSEHAVLHRLCQTSTQPC